MSHALRSAVRRFVREDDGASLVEYVLLVALIAVVCLGAITLLGDEHQRQTDDGCQRPEVARWGFCWRCCSGVPSPGISAPAGSRTA